MLVLSLLSLIFSALPASVLAQATGGSQTPIVYDAIHNATDIEGTWSTGSGAVQTGPGFANPLNYTFFYPPTTGVSFSFKPQPISDANGTFDGYFEQAEYRMTSNATDPHCITGVVTWQHGKYQLLSNGSILLTPFAADGRQQVQDPCAPISNQLTQWNTTVLFLQWRIFALTTNPGATTSSNGGFHLNLYAFDGSPLAPMSLMAKPPNMLPTQVLSTTNSSTAAPAAVTNPNPGSSNSRRSRLEARSDAPRTTFVAGGIAGLAGVGAMVLLVL